MAYNISKKFREKVYSGENLYKTILTIDGEIIPISQIISITISSPIVDTSSDTMYVGSFISQQLKIKFKNLDGINITSGSKVNLQIGQKGNWKSQDFTGSDITVENALQETIDIQIDGNSSQDGTPTPDSPIPIEVVKGKNLFDDSKVTKNYYYNENKSYVYYENIRTSDYIEVSEGKEYTISYEQIINAQVNVRINLFNSSKVIQKQYVSSSTTTGAKTYTFTIPSGIKYVRFSNTTLNGYLNQDTFQLEQNTEATTYLPYNTIEIEQRGKNLFDENGDITTGKMYDGSGNQISGSNTDFALNDYIEVKPSTTYTISGSIYIRLCEYNSSKTFISRSVTTGGATSSTFTTTANTYYVRLSALTTSIDGIQLEIGASTTDYEPYVTPQTYQIPLGENYLAKVGSVQDKLVISRNGKCKISKNISNVILNGSETTLYYQSTNGGVTITNYPSDRLKSIFNGYCSHFMVEKTYSTWTQKNYCGWNSSGTFWIRDDKEVASSLDEWKSWLSTNKPIVYYQLATPSEIELDSIEPIQIWDGTNIFTIKTNIDTDSSFTVMVETENENEKEYWYVPIGEYQIDELDENYQTTCEITCLDNAVKFKQAIDYSGCFTDGKATIDTILKYICTQCDVELDNNFPTTNGTTEIGTYDSTISGKQWISYIAEIKGCNAKIGRDGRLYLIPLKQASEVSINALRSKSWTLGEKYELSQVKFYNGGRWLESPQEVSDVKNILYIRQANPFVDDTSQEFIDNIYNVVKGFINYNIKIENVGDISLDAWDNITYTLGDETYNTLNDNTITYKMSIMSTVESKIPTKQVEETTNVIKQDALDVAKKVLVTVNNVEGTITTLSSNITSLDTTVNNNYQELTQKFDGYTPISRTATLEDNVTTLQTNTYLKTEVNQILKGEFYDEDNNQIVSEIVKTTSATFDENGMTYEKTGSETSSTINEKGIEVDYIAKGTSSKNELLFAGYDSDSKQSVVRADNFTCKNHLIMGEIHRFEKYKPDNTYKQGIGVFDI